MKIHCLLPFVWKLKSVYGPARLLEKWVILRVSQDRNFKYEKWHWPTKIVSFNDFHWNLSKTADPEKLQKYSISPPRLRTDIKKILTKSYNCCCSWFSLVFIAVQKCRIFTQTVSNIKDMPYEPLLPLGVIFRNTLTLYFLLWWWLNSVEIVW